MKDRKHTADQIREFIDGKLNPFLKVREISDALEMHAPSMEELFRRSYGTPIKKHINSQCLKMIQGYINDGTMKGSAIAEQIGFKTDQAFYKWFRRAAGCSFPDYVKKCRGEGEEKPSSKRTNNGCK